MAANLVTLRDGRGQSIVFFHPASGLATAFRRLVPYLPAEATVFAFENTEPVGPPSSIGALAASYWSELQTVAGGSLFLVGWSFGGTVALELATIAEAAGHEVAAAVLLDAGAPQLMRSAPSLPLHDLAGLFGISAHELPVGAAPASEADMIGLLVDILRSTRGIVQIESADLQPFVDAYRWHQSVIRKPWTYRGRRGPVYLVRARDERCWDTAPADLGWSGILGAPPIALWTPGTHHDLMSEAHAPDLARLLSTIFFASAGEAPPRCVGGGAT
jgi:thioesterase domain-containing protein